MFYFEFKTYEIYDIDRVRPVCLPINKKIRSLDVVGSEVYVAGWGSSREGGNTSNELQKVEISVLENYVCENRYKIERPDVRIDNRTLCAGDQISKII